MLATMITPPRMHSQIATRPTGTRSWSMLLLDHGDPRLGAARAEQRVVHAGGGGRQRGERSRHFRSHEVLDDRVAIVDRVEEEHGAIVARLGVQRPRLLGPL